MITRLSLINELDDIANDATHPLAKDVGVAAAGSRAATSIQMRIDKGRLNDQHGLVGNGDASQTDDGA